MSVAGCDLPQTRDAEYGSAEINLDNAVRKYPGKAIRLNHLNRFGFQREQPVICQGEKIGIGNDERRDDDIRH